MAQKFCSYCGATVSPQQTFCDKCGSKLQPDTQPTEKYNQTNQDYQTQHPPAYPDSSSQQNIPYPSKNYPTPPSGDISDLSKTTLILLWLFLGWMGVHHFYAGKVGLGLLYFCTGGLFGIGWLIDFCIIVGDDFTDSQGRRIVKG